KPLKRQPPRHNIINVKQQRPQIEQQAIFNITQRHTPLKINYYEIEKDRSKTNDSVTKKKKQNFQNQNISSSFPLQPSLQNSLQLSSGQENKTFLQTPNNNKIIFENINTSQQREEKVVFVKEVKTEIIIDSNITPPIIKHPINSSSDMSSGMSTITTTKSSNNHNNNGGSGRTGILSQKEDKYPISSTPYFPTKNSGIEKWPTPSIDTTRPERAGRMVMEGWPSSPRSRMKLASPRFKSLNDLEEGPEGNDQPGQKSYNQNASLNSYCSSSLASSTNNNISDNSGDNRLILTSKEPNLDTMGRNDREIIVEEEEVEEGFKVEDISSLKLSDEFFNSGGFSGSRRTLGISLNSPKRPFYHDNNSGSSISSIDGKDSEDEHQQKQKPKNEKRLSEVQPSTNEPTANNRSGMIGREHYKNSSRLTTRLFSSIQSRRTVPQISRSKNVKITTDSSPSFPMAKTPSSELSSTSTPSTPLTTIQTPLNSATTPTAWKWPKRPFSPAREKQKEELIKPGDNPAEHIGKVGNLWAKKTLVGIEVDVIDEKLKTEIIIDSNITPPIIKHPINSSSDMSSGMSTITTTKSSNNHNNNGGSGRTGILSQKEDKYPISSTPYFPTKNSGIEKWPTPSIDTTRPERAGRMVMEGWPSSPRSRMKLASPRFKSLNDLEEGPEGNDQPGQKSYNQNASLNSYCSSSLASSTNNNISDNSGDNRLILTSKEPNLDTMGRNDREIIVEEEEVEEGFKVE
ncbi:8165_t:CDS:10, partial [Entrophospora sp. SA101]